MRAHEHDWRGQTWGDEWRGVTTFSLFVCASCGMIYHPLFPGSVMRWTSPCSGSGESHRERYALPKGRKAL